MIMKRHLLFSICVISFICSGICDKITIRELFRALRADTNAKIVTTRELHGANPQNADDGKSNSELSEAIHFLETEMFLLTGETMTKEELMVKEILELKRSVFLLKRAVNGTTKGRRDLEKQLQMENSSENSGDAGIMENFSRLENRINYLEHENKEKNKKILELEDKLKSSN